MTFPSQVFRQQDIAWSASANSAVSGGDLNFSGQGNRILPPGRRVVVEEITGSAAPDSYSRGFLHRRAFPVGSFNVHKGLEGWIEIFNVRLPIVSGIDPNIAWHGCFSSDQRSASVEHVGVVAHGT